MTACAIWKDNERVPEVWNRSDKNEIENERENITSMVRIQSLGQMVIKGRSIIMSKADLPRSV